MQPLGAVARDSDVGARPAAVQRVDERGGLRGRPQREEEGTIIDYLLKNDLLFYSDFFSVIFISKLNYCADFDEIYI